MEYNTSLMNSSNKKSNYSYFNTEIGGENLKEKMIKYSKNIRIKSKRNSYKPPLKINNYFVDVNEEDSKYYKLNYPKTHFKTNGNFYKRLKYSNLTESRYDENNSNEKNNKDKRSKLIEKLIYNSQINFVQDFQKKKQKESESKEYKIMQDKIEVLKKSGIDVNTLFKEIKEKENKNECEEDDNKKENNNNNNNEKKEIHLKFKNLISENENNRYEEYNTNKNNQRKILNSELKTSNSKEKSNSQRKPMINSLEFYMKIKDYLRNKGKNSKENETNRNSINSQKNTYRSVSLPKKENNVFKYNNNDENNNQPAFYSRNNIRGKDEVQKFIKDKEKIRKTSEDKLKKEEKNKILHNYLNYSKLQKSIEKKKILLIKKKKVKNNYYVGNNQINKSNYNQSKSAVVEKNDMFKIMRDNKKLKSNGKKPSEKKNYNFIKMQEDTIKKGKLEYFINDSPNSRNNDNNGSFQKKMVSAEKIE